MNELPTREEYFAYLLDTIDLRVVGCEKISSRWRSGLLVNFDNGEETPYFTAHSHDNGYTGKPVFKEGERVWYQGPTRLSGERAALMTKTSKVLTN